MIPDIHAGKRLYFCVFPLLPGLSFSLRADALSMVFAVSASFLWVITVFYSAGYMRGLNEHEQTRFNTCFALALFGAIGCAFSDNLLTLYLFYEIVSICTYPLVAHHQDEESYESGKKYLTYLTATAKGLMLPAMVLIYVLTGNLDFANNINTGILPPDVNRWVVTGLYACCILGFAKNGVMPFHSWLPSAMVAPTPVSALLHAVAVVKVGVFSTVRVMLYVFGVDTMRAPQPRPAHRLFRLHHHRRRLHHRAEQGQPEGAAGLLHRQPALLHHSRRGLLTRPGIEGGLVHIANHAFSKITLFFCAGAIYVATHKKNISEMNGLGRVMPWTFGAFALASLSMIGAPPVAGFVSKWYLLNGAFDAGSVGIIVVLLVSTAAQRGLLRPGGLCRLLRQTFRGRRQAQIHRGPPGAGDSPDHHRGHLRRHRPLPRLLHELRPRCPAMNLVKLIQFLRDRLKTVTLVGSRCWCWRRAGCHPFLVIMTRPHGGRNTSPRSGPYSVSSPAS
jgi:multicomponent Na+:H+ antiporter subunit D